MIIGSSDGRGRPHVRGRLIFPRLNLGFPLSFRVDTGSDCTVLLPADAKLLQIPYDRLRDVMTVGGIGVKQKIYFREECVLLFAEGNATVKGYTTSIGIAPLDDDANYTLPSLLGQDILQFWRMRHDPPNNRLEFTVTSAHHTFRGNISNIADRLLLEQKVL